MKHLKTQELSLRIVVTLNDLFVVDAISLFDVVYSVYDAQHSAVGWV
jgi:hypothetical protein